MMNLDSNFSKHNYFQIQTDNDAKLFPESAISEFAIVCMFVALYRLCKKRKHDLWVFAQCLCFIHHGNVQQILEHK